MDQSTIESYKKAGNIAKQAREFALDFVKPGMKLLDIAEAIEGKIKELGADIGFPVNLSLNEIAAHATPLPREETVAEGILKIDIGTSVDGYIGDTAVTLDLTEDKKFSEMIELNKKLLNAAKSVIGPKAEVRDIGRAITDTLSEYNVMNETDYTIISGLTGHGLDKDTIHTSPSIPNYANSISRKLADLAFAVEPFVTSGSGEIYEGSPGGIYVLKNPNGKVRDKDAREILQFIVDNYKTRPFCERWLDKQDFKKLRFALRELTNQKIIHHYPLLIERTKSPVSQMEHTFVVTQDDVFCTTK